MITDCFDIETEPIIKVSDFCGEKKHLVDVCLIIFSWEIQEHLLNTFECEKIGELGACNGRKPIYKIHYKGKDVAFYLTGIGSAVAAMQCYEASWLIGATKFIMFGSCGSLDREQTYGKYIVPTESYRGEGLSYYYAEPADYIEIKNAYKLATIFEEMGVPHVLGRNWTTDALYRETKGLVAKRKEEGCLSVEMELAGVQAVCDYHGLELFDFLEAGDVLEASGYEVEGLHNANHDFGKLYIGLEVALRV